MVHKDAKVVDFRDGNNWNPRFRKSILETDANSRFLHVALPFLALRNWKDELILKMNKKGYSIETVV